MTNLPPQYFVRQATLHGIGSAGLVRLRDSTVGIAGAGGVGSSAAYYLSRSGIGRIVLVDQDIVEPTNLQRLHAVTKEDLFHPKAEAVCKRLSDPNNGCRLDPITETITDKNIDGLFRDANIVVDGLDNFRTRYIINDFSCRKKIPYLFSSAVSEQAHITLFNPPSTPCLECLMPSVLDRFQDSCETLGVSPAVIGVVGAMIASEVTRFLTGQPTSLVDYILTIDAAGPEFLFTKSMKREDCRACSGSLQVDMRNSPSVSYLCGEHTANVLPPALLDLSLPKTATLVPPDKRLVTSESVLVFRHGPFTVSLFRNGRLLIDGIDEEARVGKLAGEIWSFLRIQMPVSQTI